MSLFCAGTRETYVSEGLSQFWDSTSCSKLRPEKPGWDRRPKRTCVQVSESAIWILR